MQWYVMPHYYNFTVFDLLLCINVVFYLLGGWTAVHVSGKRYWHPQTMMKSKSFTEFVSAVALSAYIPAHKLRKPLLS